MFSLKLVYLYFINNCVTLWVSFFVLDAGKLLNLWSLFNSYVHFTGLLCYILISCGIVLFYPGFPFSLIHLLIYILMYRFIFVNQELSLPINAQNCPRRMGTQAL